VHVLNWQPVESSVLASAAYLPSEHLLYLRFHSGDIYRYFGFPPEQYRAFLAAESKGRFLSYHIRDRFRYEQVARSSQAGAG